EGGMRVPGIARWPRHIPAGHVCSELATTLDLLPTFSKFAGAALPADRKLDGHDIGPLLCGEANAKSPWEVFYYYFGDELHAVRRGPWKLVFPHRYPSTTVSPAIVGRAGVTEKRETPLALYNL